MPCWVEIGLLACFAVDALPWGLAPITEYSVWQCSIIVAPGVLPGAAGDGWNRPRREPAITY
jgi:hypothetical protein